MARRKKAYAGTLQEHRAQAASHLREMRKYQRLARQALAKGDCKQAARHYVLAEVLAARGNENQRWTIAPGKGKAFYNPRQYASAASIRLTRQFFAKCF